MRAGRCWIPVTGVNAVVSVAVKGFGRQLAEIADFINGTRAIAAKGNRRR
jgi:hypothetical protein